jgi:hypothetical protein
MLTLYFAKGTCALASHIALEDAGAAYVPPVIVSYVSAVTSRADSQALQHVRKFRLS